MGSCSMMSCAYEGLAQNTFSDKERAREVYKYFRPPVATEPLDTVLTAHAQLVAWRLNAERSMISLIDEETQYFIAESTKTVHLDDAEQYDNPEDAIWAGCVRAPKAGRLCEHTVAALPPPEGGPACFEVLDLSKDIRFHTLSFVEGDPYFKYYAGVPLRTSRGINIGSIYILDSKVRPALTHNEKSFFGIMADNVIQHLEMSRDKKDRQRTLRMNECLSAYVDAAFEDTKHRRRHSQNSESTGTDSDADSKRTTDGSARLDVITRAADLLREAMDLEDGGGGVLFLDTSLAAIPLQQAGAKDERSHEGPYAKRPELQDHSQQMDGLGSGDTTQRTSGSPNPVPSGKRINSAEVLAHTFQSVDVSSEQPEFTPFTPEELLKLLKHHPRGKMFTFDQQGQELSDSSHNESINSGRPMSKRRQRTSTAEAASLRAHFPKARQIMLIPVWDSTTSRSAACFVYNCSEYRNFSHQLDFLHCITFNNCVDTELLRLANLKASEQKSDFIGSISHELRSPLHGILASCEFLQDTTCTSFQQSLVNTAESCARTLLDTVNMVLDYSKINAFEKGKTSIALSDDAKVLQTSLSTHRNIDLALLTEEVVEGVAAGHAFNDPQNRALRHEATNNQPSTHKTSASYRPEVELIVAISKQNWTSWCEPGAMRRIVMNLVGNSLKYTNTGYVHVELNTQCLEPNKIEYGVLTVTDTGQGMSSNYLKNKLYTPFAQESNQAPGIGLGLSLVKSIVNTLGGQIAIDSTVGVGTKVIVKIPLHREPKARIESAHSHGHVDKANSVDDCTSDIIQTIRTRTQATGRSAALCWHIPKGVAPSQDEASRLMRTTLMAYLDTWCGFSVSQWNRNSTADIVITEAADLQALLQDNPQLSNPGCKTMVLVLRSISSAQDAELSSIEASNIKDVRHPLGPYKLARALLACLDHPHHTPEDSAATGLSGDVASISIDAIVSKSRNLDISDNKFKAEEKHTLKRDSPHFSDDGSNGDQSNGQTVKSSAEDKDQPQPNCELINHPNHGRTIPAATSPVPLRKPDVQNNEPLLPSSTPAPPGITPSQHQHVLIVDDNTINLRLLQVGIKKSGYSTITSATNGLEAVTIYRTLLSRDPSIAPAIILMDLSMPVMNGFDATRQIREIEARHNAMRAVPRRALIIALTGLASVRDQKEAYTSGVDSYIMKPVSFAKLTKVLEEWTAEGKVGAVKAVLDAAVMGS